MQPSQNPYEPPAPNSVAYTPQPAYGPAPQAPRGTVSMDVISEAWRYLSPNIGPWILAALAYFGIPYAIGLVRAVFQSLGQNGSALWYVLAVLVQLIAWVITPLLLGGMMKMALATVRTRVANVNEMWSVADRGVTLVVSAILQGLVYVVACIPGFVVMGASFVPLLKTGLFSPVVLASGKFPSIPPALIGTVIGGILLGFLLLIVLSIPVSAMLLLTTTFIIDRKAGPWQAMAQSFGALKKHFWSAILVSFVLGLVNFAGAMVCGVGLLFSFPLVQIATVLIYRDLFGMDEVAPTTTIYAPPPIANPNF